MADGIHVVELLTERRLMPATFGRTPWHRVLSISSSSKRQSVPLTFDEIYAENVWHVYAYFAYRLGSREDAEDLTQITFERAARALTRYDPDRSAPRTWLLAIAHNLLIDHFRRERHSRKHVSLDEGKTDELEAASASLDALPFGLDPELSEAIAVLSDRDRAVIALRYGGGLTGPEIAELMDLTLANVQQILSRSLRRMRATIEEQRGMNQQD